MAPRELPQSSPELVAVQGIRIPETPRLTTPEIQVLQVETFALSQARGAEGAAQFVDLDEETVVEVETEEGIRFWVNAADLGEVFVPSSFRGEAPATLRIGPDSLSRGESRGLLGKVVLKTLRFFKLDVAELAARKLAAKWEARTVNLAKGSPSAELFRCLAKPLVDEDGKPQILQALQDSDKIPNQQPVLLFLHGTASSTEGSFSELWEQPAPYISKLFQSYKQHVYALEHKTLTAGPIQNALDLLAALPEGARLHLVSHSRGGLIGEILCRGSRLEGEPFDAAEQAGWDVHRGDLAKLNEELRKKRVRVERFVRVACPARGTNLASQRLDLYLSVLFNLLQRVGGKVPVLGQALDLFSELILAIAKERSDPQVLPGLESMVPGSPLIRLINRPGVRVGGEIRVIAGDIEGGDLGSLFSTLLTDPLYQDDHDLVVNTDAMFGGAEREAGRAFYFERGPGVSHFRYFQNPSTASRLLQTLTRAPEAADEFKAFPVEIDEDVKFYTRGPGEEPRHAVVVLPGISGSTLSAGNQRIWADLGSLAFGGLGKLDLESGESLVASGLVSSAYKRLHDRLALEFEVVAFPYDWRRSVNEAAALLAEKVEKLLRDPQRKDLPVSLLAHSMGGLVARALITRHEKVWKDLCARTAAPLVMLGTPDQGSYSIVSLLLGREKLLRQLALLDLRHKQRELSAIFARFPGLLELLPPAGLLGGTWESWKAVESSWVSPASAGLAAAKSLREGLKSWTPDLLAQVRYVAGRADATPIDLEIRQNRKGRKELVLVATSRGDGRVPWDTIPAGMETWYVNAAHGDLADTPEAFAGLIELLRKGTTSRLSRVPPSGRSLAAERFELPAEPQPLFPTESALLQAGLGRGRTILPPVQGPRTTVSILHGDLCFASYPVMTGHYKGDSIVSAEKALNAALGDRLVRRQRLGLYPGEIGTYEVALDDQASPPGAIVVGLGEVGRLNALALTQTVANGAAAYAMEVLEARRTVMPMGAPLGVGLSTLLVGTGAAGLSVTESIEAVLRGISLANDVLELPFGGPRVRIEHVELVELYADRAIQAAKTLSAMARNASVAASFALEAIPRVTPGTGGLRRAYYREDPSWWGRLQVLEKEGRLTFSNFTDRARAEVSLQGTDRQSVDQFVQDLTRSTSTDIETSITLYEMLVPHELKERARERGNLVLILDASSARYPWELMQEKDLGGAAAAAHRERPLAVESGLVRQLQTAEFRAHASIVTENTALVIGDPPSHLPELAGARAEAQEVEKRLSASGFTVRKCIRDEDRPKDPLDKEILKNFFVHSYRIVHLAGHGQYREDGQGKATEAGMAIGNHRWLTVDHVKSLRPVPEIVFVNCCHLGKTEEDRRKSPVDFPRLAANLGAALIQIGVKVVIAAGWAVEDAAARCFAGSFYDEMLGGKTFGDAVRKAREDTYASFPNVNTWGAYQCYGDPSYRLTLPRSAGDDWVPSFSSVQEPLLELANLAELAKTSRGRDLQYFAQRLQKIQKAVPELWLEAGDLQAAFGAAYGEVEMFAEAIPYYEAAVAKQDGRVTFWAVGQLCHLESRLALQRFREGSQGAAELIQKAADRMEVLARLHSTPEVHGLRASIAKRQVVLAEGGSAKKKGLRTVRDQYKQAWKLTGKLGDPLFEVGFLGAERLLLGPLAGGEDEKLAASLRQVEEQARERGSHYATASPDGRLVLALRRGTLPAEAAEIVAAYQKALQGRSARERRLVLEHLEFLIDAVGVWDDAEIVAAVRTALESMVKSLRDE